jgi:neutral ceramidase
LNFGGGDTYLLPDRFLRWLGLTDRFHSCTYTGMTTDRRPFLVCLLIAALCLAAGSNLFGGEPIPLRAGAAQVNLTPPAEMKAALGGYGARLSRPALGVHDSVWAKALVLARGDKKFALVTADVLAFPPQFKAAVMARLTAEGFSADQVMLLPSHTHTSIDMMALHPGNVFSNRQAGVFHKELFEHTAEQLAKVTQAATRDLVPAVVGSTTISVPDRNRNRRSGLTTHDSDLTVTRIDRAGGQPLAVLVNWTAHPTFMDDEDMLFSGDWPGHLQRTMEALIGHGVTAMFYNGAEGDQSPVPPMDCGSNWERAERYGREMGIIAWRAWEKIPPRQVAVFGYHTEIIALPKRQAHPDFMKTGGAEYGLNEAGVQAFLEQLVPSETRSTCLRLDELVILGVPAELAAELGLEAKAKARVITGVSCVAVGGLANEWVSYALSAREYGKGGYEASMSFYGETLGRTLVEGVLRDAEGVK